jgi:hypothetical protein
MQTFSYTKILFSKCQAESDQENSSHHDAAEKIRNGPVWQFLVLELLGLLQILDLEIGFVQALLSEFGSFNVPHGMVCASPVIFRPAPGPETSILSN